MANDKSENKCIKANGSKIDEKHDHQGECSGWSYNYCTLTSVDPEHFNSSHQEISETCKCNAIAKHSSGSH